MIRSWSTVAVLAVLAVTASCSFPTCEAKKVVDIDVPAAGLRTIDCESRNGGIRIVGDPACTTVALHADVRIRAFTDEEAAATLAQMSVAHEIVDGRLVVRGVCPEPLAGRIPGFEFAFVVPAGIAARLASHNGSLDLRGVDGDLQIETHNGGIAVTSSARRIDATTHNGEITIRRGGDGGLEGTLQSHNGGITVEAAPDVDTTVEASTHNGRLAWPDDAREVRRDGSSFSCRLGDGSARLAIVTHNGDVAIRRPAKKE